MKFKELLKLIAAVLAAIAGSLGVQNYLIDTPKDYEASEGLELSATPGIWTWEVYSYWSQAGTPDKVLNYQTVKSVTQPPLESLYVALKPPFPGYEIVKEGLVIRRIAGSLEQLPPDKGEEEPEQPPTEDI